MALLTAAGASPSPVAIKSILLIVNPNGVDTFSGWIFSADDNLGDCWGVRPPLSLRLPTDDLNLVDKRWSTSIVSVSSGFDFEVIS